VLLKRYYDDPLAQASFLLGDPSTHEAIVVDPNRDIEAYVRGATAEKLRIVAVTETHIHADFLSGTRELARVANATAYLSDEGDAEWKYAWANEPNVKLVKDGDAIRAGRVRLDVLATPGHTPEHVSFVLTDEAASPEPLGIFTGDFVFVGDVGRPDLLERAANMAGTMEKGARVLHAALQRFRERYPEHVLLWPGHGPGSACGKALGGLPVTTLAYELRTNWGLKNADPEAFVREVLAGQPEPPAYFKHMKRMNKAGPAILGGFREPRALPDAAIVAALERGDTIVDVRPTRDFVAGTIPGVFGIPAGNSFPTWAGALLPYDRPVSLLADSAPRAMAAVRQLAMIGLDDVAGWYGPGAFTAWATARGALAVTPDLDAADAFARAQRGELALLDVRGAAEYASGHVPGSKHIPLGDLAVRAAELPRDQPVAVYCATGTRSRIGVSVLRRAGFTKLMAQGTGFVGHAEAGLPVEF
jgi:hydroxyacylglutathione hydrolase